MFQRWKITQYIFELIVSVVWSCVIMDNMFYGVTVLEGEAKSSAIGGGKNNESSWCEKRIVTSRLSVNWRCKDTKFY
jgi:hypothetical protein